MKKVLSGLGVGLALSAVLGGTAWANDCANVSRTPPACYTAPGGCTSPVVVGNWVFLPSVDSTLPPIWGFGPPANFTNGKTEALTANGNINSGGAVCATPNRQLGANFDLSGVHGVLSTDQCWFGG